LSHERPFGIPEAFLEGMGMADEKRGFGRELAVTGLLEAC
jgi:hypothetical protein